jgi:hypothetical protein
MLAVHFRVRNKCSEQIREMSAVEVLHAFVSLCKGCDVQYCVNFLAVRYVQYCVTDCVSVCRPPDDAGQVMYIILACQFGMHHHALRYDCTISVCHHRQSSCHQF